MYRIHKACRPWLTDGYCQKAHATAPVGKAYTYGSVCSNTALTFCTCQALQAPLEVCWWNLCCFCNLPVAELLSMIEQQQDHHLVRAHLETDAYEQVEQLSHQRVMLSTHVTKRPTTHLLLHAMLDMLGPLSTATSFESGRAHASGTVYTPQSPHWHMQTVPTSAASLFMHLTVISCFSLPPLKAALRSAVPMFVCQLSRRPL